MKRIVAVISLALYLVATCGLVMNTHYCMKKRVSVAFHIMEIRPDVCGRCGMDMHEENDCCSDEVRVLKLVQDQVRVPVTLFLFPKPAILNLEYGIPLSHAWTEMRWVLSPRVHPPPLETAPDVFLLNRVFRI
jgi:hypothetical protein